jgi:hypothetical protein
MLMAIRVPLPVFLAIIGLFVLIYLISAIVKAATRKKPPATNDAVRAAMARVRASANDAVRAAQAAPQPTSCRMLVAPDYPFARLQESLAQLGLQLATPVASAEPESAVFADARWRVAYQYDAASGLRALGIAGLGEAKYLRNDILNMVYVPSLEGYKVGGLLQSQDPREVLLGLGAAAWLGQGADHRYYLEPVRALTAHADPAVAQAAQRTYAALAAEAAATPGA